MDTVEELIQDTNKHGFSVLIISGGGEPMTVNETILNRIIRASSEENLFSRLITNAYWATSFDESCHRLQPLVKNGLKHIVVSVSESHQEHVKHDFILNVVRAANTLNLKCDFYLTTLNVQTSPLRGIVQYFKERNQSLPYIHTENYFIPFGNAEENFDLSDFQLTDVGNMRGTCPSAGNNICVHPSGAVTFCAMVFSLNVRALHVGNIYRDSLAEIMQRVENNRLMQWLAIHGIVALKEAVEQHTDIRLADKYVNICHLCSEMLLNPKVLQFLQHVGLINES
jgi:MoaA/NifB/PqqE/SkfB family radical SAM enzyme